MAANFEGTYVMNVHISQLVAAIRDPAFSAQMDIAMRSENPTPPGVWYRFHHGVSMSSWGEKITITLQPMENNTTHMVIHSECVVPTAFIDMGKNKKVVNGIYDYLLANARRYPIVQAQAEPQPQAQPQANDEPRFCNACGASLKEGAIFCTNCGNKVR